MNILLVENHNYPLVSKALHPSNTIEEPSSVSPSNSDTPSKTWKEDDPPPLEKVRKLGDEKDWSLPGFLRAQGHQVTLCQNGDEGLQAFNTGNFNLCIFDVMLTGIDGFTLTERIRSQSPQIPIVLLTARANKEDKIKGFNLGIDDYITRPFDADELLCRLLAIHRRCFPAPQNQTEEQCIFLIGNSEFDYPNQLVTHNQKKQRLTQRESEILYHLCLHKNQIVKRADLLVKIWGKSDYFHGRSLDVFITKVRRHLKSDKHLSIKNIPRVGHILSENSNL